MKELKFKQGSLTPLWLKDFEFLQQGCAEALKAIARGLSFDNSNFIISGCKITYNGSFISMTSGWCFYEGEILRVNQLPRTQCVDFDQKIKFTKQIEYYSEGDRMATTNDGKDLSRVYTEYYLEPSLVKPGDQCTLAIGYGAWNLGERISNSAPIYDSGAQTPICGWLNLHGDVKYRQIGGTVQLYGYVKSLKTDTSVNNEPIARNLPCPITDIIIPIGNCKVTINTEGFLLIQSDEPIVDPIYLNSIVYLAAPNNVINDKHYTIGVAVKDWDDNIRDSNV